MNASQTQVGTMPDTPIPCHQAMMMCPQQKCCTTCCDCFMTINPNQTDCGKCQQLHQLTNRLNDLAASSKNIVKTAVEQATKNVLQQVEENYINILFGNFASSMN